MFHTTTCPVCNEKCSIPEGYVGRRVRCPNCDGTFLAGANESAGTPEVPVEATAVADSPAPLPDLAPPTQPAIDLAFMSLDADPVTEPLSETPVEAVPAGQPEPAPADLSAPVTATTDAGGPKPVIRFSCPTCSRALSAPARAAGNKLPCPGCGQRLLVPAAPEPPRPQLNKTVLAGASAAGVIHFTCARCQTPQTAPGDAAGTKMPCTHCGQRLQVPEATAADAPLHKTMLGATDVPPVPEFVPVEVESYSPPPLPQSVPRPRDRDRDRDDEVGACAECGRTLKRSSRLRYCPDSRCQDIFCSRSCVRRHTRYSGHRDEDYDDRPRRFQCRYCGSTEEPVQKQEISESGWVMFVVLLVFCWPLFWIPLISMYNYYNVCYDCGCRLR